jgi:nitroreductase
MISRSRLQHALRQAAIQATLAPSLYNTQPWRFDVASDQLRIALDYDRWLPHHDPDGRQLTVSCGCALLNARVSLAADGLVTAVTRFPGGSDGIAALLTPTAEADPTVARDDLEDLAGLASTVSVRHTNRQGFTCGIADTTAIRHAQAAAAREGAELLHLETADQRRTALALHHEAGRLSADDPARLAEHRAWAATAGLIPDRSERIGSEVTASALRTDRRSGRPGGPQLFLLSSADDNPLGWLRAGEALERILLQLTGQGYVTSLSSQVTQLPETRDRLRNALGLAAHPLVLLQVGLAPPSPPTRRRRLVEVIVDSSEGLVRTD